jgi:hypothetical protein
MLVSSIDDDGEQEVDEGECGKTRLTRLRSSLNMACSVTDPSDIIYLLIKLCTNICIVVVCWLAGRQPPNSISLVIRLPRGRRERSTYFEVQSRLPHVSIRTRSTHEQPIAAIMKGTTMARNHFYPPLLFVVAG